jgi:hypothetical protein
VLCSFQPHSTKKSLAGKTLQKTLSVMVDVAMLQALCIYYGSPCHLATRAGAKLASHLLLLTQPSQQSTAHYCNKTATAAQHTLQRQTLANAAPAAAAEQLQAAVLLVDAQQKRLQQPIVLDESLLAAACTVAPALRRQLSLHAHKLLHPLLLLPHCLLVGWVQISRCSHSLQRPTVA